MEELWHQILELTSQFVIPDWGELIGLLPIGLAALVILWFAWTIRRFATAGPTRRAPARVAPVAPAGLHMPGPSWAPVFGAIGAAALVWGFAVGGAALLVGGTILCLTLLYWGREALRDYDHATHAETLPAVVHAGPPPGVHMPGPSFRPILGALGTAALLAGLVFGGWVLAAGVVILVLTLVGWGVDAVREFRKTVEADRTGHLENIPAPGWPRGLLQFGAVIFTLAVLLQAGIIPPKVDDETAGEPGGSPAPSEVPPQTAWTIVAQKVAYDIHEIVVPAGSAFTIEFHNEDAPGVPHDVDIRESDGTTVIADEPLTDGGATATYSYEPLEAGSYVFICSFHPSQSMTGTVVVR